MTAFFRGKEAVKVQKKYNLPWLWILAGVLLLSGLVVLGWWAVKYFSFTDYMNKKEGVALRYPRTWELKEHPQENVIAAFVAPRKNALQKFQENINVSMTDLSKSPLTIEQYAEMVPRQMTAVFDDVVVEEKKVLALSGHPAVKFVFRSKGDFSTVIVVYAFIYSDVAYNITYTGLAEQYALSKPLIDQVAGYVKIFF